MAIYQGNRVIYLWRLASKQTTEAANNIAFQTDGSEKITNDVSVTKTKSGSVTTSSGAEVEISMTVVAASENDTVCDDLKNAVKNGEDVGCWKVNLAKAGTTTGKYKGTYYEGKVSDYEESFGSEDHVEIQVTYKPSGTGYDGDVTVTADQLAIASYVFKDTTVGA